MTIDETFFIKYMDIYIYIQHLYPFTYNNIILYVLI